MWLFKMENKIYILKLKLKRHTNLKFVVMINIVSNYKEIVTLYLENVRLPNKSRAVVWFSTWETPFDKFPFDRLKNIKGKLKMIIQGLA